MARDPAEALALWRYHLIAEALDPRLGGRERGLLVRRIATGEHVTPALPPATVASARATMAERWPWEAQTPFEALRTAAFPKLVFSGAHSAPFDAVCDVLVERLAAERSVIGGAGHGVQRTGEPFNHRLRAFIDAV